MDKWFVSPVAYNNDFQSLDDYCESLLDWKLDVRQLVPGPAKASVLTFSNSDVSYQRFSRGLKTINSGSPMIEGVAFFVPEKNHQGLIINNVPMSSDVLCCQVEGGSVEMIFPDDFVGFSFTVSYRLLKELQLDWLVATVSEGLQVLSMSARESECVRTALREVEGLLLSSVEAPDCVNYGISHHIQYRLIPLVSCMMLRYGSFRSSLDKEGDRACFQVILNRISLDLESPPSVAELAQEAEVSVRYVQLLFKRYLGLTPKRFIRSLRLNAVRHDLKTTSLKSGRVTELASQAGFDHFGQFAKDYKKLFGELPKETAVRLI